MPMSVPMSVLGFSGTESDISASEFYKPPIVRLMTARSKKVLSALDFTLADTEGKVLLVTRNELLRITKEAIDNSKAIMGQNAVAKEALDTPQTRSKLPEAAFLQSRDLRKLEATFTTQSEPSLEVRQHCLIVNADPVRAVLLHGRCLVLLAGNNAPDTSVGDNPDDIVHRQPNRNNSLGHVLRQRLTDTSDNRNYSFEFRVLEGLLMTVVHDLDKQWAILEPSVQSALIALLKTQTQLEKLRQLKNRVAAFKIRVGGLRRAIVEILDEEEVSELHTVPHV
jgi:hypothetical protein